MSAFVVSNRTINKILSYIDDHRVYPFSKSWTQTPMKPLGKKMYSMNAEAVNLRYPNDIIVDKYGYSYCYESPPTEIEAYKMLQCFLYQCSEGTVSESNLYRDLESILARIASIVIVEMESYQKVYWG